MDFRGRSGEQVLKPGGGGATSWAPVLAIVCHIGNRAGRTVPMLRRPCTPGQSPSMPEPTIARREWSCRKRAGARQRHGQYPVRQGREQQAARGRASLGGGGGERVPAAAAERG